MDVITATKQFEKEQTDLVKCILNNRFFYPWKEPSLNNYDFNFSLNQESALEIFITPTCNQHCEYCYLVKNPELYPPEINDKDKILKNLDILYNWCIDNDFFLPRIDFFTGEIWQSNYGLEVLEITYQAIQRGLRVGYFLIPSNCSFLLDKVQSAKIQHCINKFKEINAPLIFSISVDGAVIENESRPLNSDKIKKTNRFYEDVFLFAHHNDFKFHPMVSSQSVHKWIENYKWWTEMCEQYDCNINTIMMLEVRNNNWTDDSIQSYCEFLDFLIEEKLQKVNYNNFKFFEQLFNYDNSNDENCHGYVPYYIGQTDTFAGCTVSNCLTVRLGDLAICPCHRLSYNKYLYGNFIVENNKIVDIKGNNPEIAARILIANNNLVSMDCDNCLFNKCCLKGCFGSQYESEKDPFFPCNTVCEFFKGKYTFLIKKYLNMGIIEFLQSISPYSINYISAQENLKDFLLYKEGLSL